MKTFTTTLALVLTATVMMAFPNGSQLTVEVLGHRPNSLIVINGQKYSSLQNVVNLDGLMPGNYPVQILRPTHWGDQGVVFNGTIQVPGRSSVHAVIARNRMTVDAVPLAHQHGGNYWDGNGQSQGTTHIPSPNGNGGFVSTLPHHQPVVQPVVCPPAYIGMHPEAFVGALESIKAQWFDSDRIRVAKQIIRTNPISSQQIAEIMQLMSFESSRLEIAKFSYQFATDRENFFIVNDVFWFSSSVRELDRFINRC
ncbi:MAG: DUF4476 domain-containing protein [Flavobacteriales bacterium]|nr:DUF4476 domain-containing protein [Flavobacteriales bacterium]